VVAAHSTTQILSERFALICIYLLLLPLRRAGLAIDALKCAANC